MLASIQAALATVPKRQRAGILSLVILLEWGSYPVHVLNEYTRAVSKIQTTQNVHHLEPPHLHANGEIVLFQMVGAGACPQLYLLARHAPCQTASRPQADARDLSPYCPQGVDFAREGREVQARKVFVAQQLRHRLSLETVLILIRLS